jgi:hypothetical protein
LFCHDIFPTGGGNNCFAKSIYHNEHGVIIVHRGKIDDEVHCYEFPDAERYLVGL